MKITKFLTTVILSLVLSCVVDGQFFSTSGGVILPRNGRSIFENQPRSVETKWRNNIEENPKYFWKRNNGEFGPYQFRSRQDYITKEELINFLYNKLMALDN